MIFDLFRNTAKFDSVNTFCMFIGYPRSGHTLYGALLDAHKNCVISHELNVLQLMKKGRSKKNIYQAILQNSIITASGGRKNEGYAYRVEGQWQGKFEKILVIGDKQGGRSSRMLAEEPDLLDSLQKRITPKIKLLHVYRNPFDNLSSRSKGGKLQKKDAGFETLKSDMEKHFVQATINDKIRKEGRFEVLDIKHEDFIADPKTGLKNICRFLELEASNDYLEACSNIVFQKPHKTRHDIKWTEDLIKEVENRIAIYDFLKDYTFND